MRRKKYLVLVAVLSLLMLGGCRSNNTSNNNSNSVPVTDIEETENKETSASGENSDVYMTKGISSEGLMAMYKALGRETKGKVGVKLSTGEPGGNYFLDPNLIKDLVQSVDGTIVENNTAYGGQRASTALHYQVAKDHGFTAIAPVDILDEEGSISLPVKNGKHLTEDLVGSHFENYDSFVVLSHFKGHAMGGFGGALKNISIGFASQEGKNMIHTAGESNTTMMGGVQDDFLESMAEASGAVMASAGENILYISVMNNLSVDCDCDSNPAKPEIHDIGILASLDPVALDKACVDLIYAADDKENASLKERIESRNGTHILDYAEEIGIGSQKYTLKSIDE